jgi:phage-related protein
MPPPAVSRRRDFRTGAGCGTVRARYSVCAIPWGEVGLEPEVVGRFGSLTEEQARVGFHVDRLAATGARLDEPHTKQLDGELRELRFYLGSTPTRITYWIAPGRVIVLLTVFTKTRQNERREVERARRALTRCMNEHGLTGDD